MSEEANSAAMQPTTRDGLLSELTDEDSADSQRVSLLESPLSSPLMSPLAISTILKPSALDTNLAKYLSAKEPLVASINLAAGPNFNRLQVASLANPNAEKIPTDLYCTRVHFSAGAGICLKDQIQSLSAQTLVTIFDDTFQPIKSFLANGIPSRARVSPTGRHVAFTVFVLGHSYAGDEFSTATFLQETNADITQGSNLEEFTVFQDGEEIDYPDFNYWGVTFSQDEDTFYATLRFNGTRNLVRGSIKDRTITVLHENVECPSLSPDETRVAFKHRIGLGRWRLTVMDLATFAQTPLAETSTVDVQAVWLDNDNVLYSVANRNPPPIESVFVVPADGTGEPRIYIEAAREATLIHES
ncbi:MAG: TolB-like translocation protein [Chloroflexota bacterium]